MSSKNAKSTKTSSPRLRGVDRRDKSRESNEKQETSSRVRFDEKGNPVFEMRANAPRRRKDDNTIDLLKCLEDDSLTLADDDN